jgi:hypothetical protein
MPTRTQLLILLVSVSPGCWEARTLGSETPAETSTGCTGDSCGAAGSQSDPSRQPLACSARRPKNNPGEKLCKAGTLEVNCFNAPPKIPCPATLTEGTKFACEHGGGRYVALCNACGGATLRVLDPSYTYEMHYDDAGLLQGVTLVEDEPVGPCEQREFVFGTHCSAVEPRAELVLSCGTRGDDGA